MKSEEEMKYGMGDWTRWMNICDPLFCEEILRKFNLLFWAYQT